MSEIGFRRLVMDIVSWGGSSIVPRMESTSSSTEQIQREASISGHGRAQTTNGEGGRVVKVDNREDFVKIIKKDEPLIILVDGMIDMFDPLCPCKTMHTVRLRDLLQNCTHSPAIDSRHQNSGPKPPW